MTADACAGCGSHGVCGQGRVLSLPYQGGESFSTGEKLKITISRGFGIKLVLLIFGGGLAVPGLLAALLSLANVSSVVCAAVFLFSVFVWIVLSTKLAKKFTKISWLDVERL